MSLTRESISTAANFEVDFGARHRSLTFQGETSLSRPRERCLGRVIKVEATIFDAEMLRGIAGMQNQNARQPDITVTLPVSTSRELQISALQRAGVPVDRFGEATSGFLFVRTVGHAMTRVHIFRWFAPATEETVPTHLISGQAATAIDYLKLWRQLERQALLELRALNQKLLTYLRETGPAPDLAEFDAVNRTYAAAHRSLVAANMEIDRLYPPRP